MKTLLPLLAADLGTTDRTLRRALQQGLLRAERASPRTVELPLEERAYLHRAWPLLSRLRQVLRTEPGISLAVLFGSRARGDDHPGSDVDLVVRLRPGAHAREVAARLSDKLGLRVQLVTLEDAEAVPLLLADVLRDGRVLVDREAEWPRITRRRRSIERAAREEERRLDADAWAALERLASR